jgi:hypothetical protein
MMRDDRSDYLRKRYRMDRIGIGQPPQAKPPEPAQKAAAPAPSCKAEPSSFLSRLARASMREGASSSAKAGWITQTGSVDSSSPAANLTSRLRWVETAFRKEDLMTQPIQPMQQVPQAPPQAMPPQQAPEMPQQQTIPVQPVPLIHQAAQEGDQKKALIIVRQRLQNLRAELELIDRDLSLLEQKLA